MTIIETFSLKFKFIAYGAEHKCSYADVRDKILLTLALAFNLTKFKEERKMQYNIITYYPFYWILIMLYLYT